jgi:hypothetical protein
MVLALLPSTFPLTILAIDQLILGIGIIADGTSRQRYNRFLSWKKKLGRSDQRAAT